MSAPPRTSPVDGRGARIVALLIAAAVAALLAYIKWDNFFPPERIASPEEAAFQHCMSERAAGIDEMVRQQAITADGRRADATPTAVRIGFSAGDVAWEKDHPHGIDLLLVVLVLLVLVVA